MGWVMKLVWDEQRGAGLIAPKPFSLGLREKESHTGDRRMTAVANGLTLNALQYPDTAIRSPPRAAVMGSHCPALGASGFDVLQ